MNKILITGGAGFIGSHLAERLVKTSEVYCLDNYFTGSKDNHIDGVTYINGSTKDIFKLIDFKVDIIYHLGEYSRVEQSFVDITTTFDYNRTGTFAVLEFVRVQKCKLIYAGSSTKFSSPHESPYAWSKASNTELVINYGKWFNIDYAITYFYNVYGRREIKSGKYATVIALFLKQAQEGKQISVVKPGTQIRNFTHINDIISGIILVGKHGSGDGFGIGSDIPYTIDRIASVIANKYSSEIIYIPERAGNRMSADVITEKIKKLGWKEEYKLIDYIEEI